MSLTGPVRYKISGNSHAYFLMILQTLYFYLLEKVYNPSADHSRYSGLAESDHRWLILKTKQFLCKTVATTIQ